MINGKLFVLYDDLFFINSDLFLIWSQKKEWTVTKLIKYELQKKTKAKYDIKSMMISDEHAEWCQSTSIGTGRAVFWIYGVCR